MPKRKRNIVIEVSPETLRTVALTALSGVRSMASPALLSRAIARRDVNGLGGTPFAKLGSGRVTKTLQALMIGEMVGDKTSFVPARTSGGALFGRILSGALVGSALFVSEGCRGKRGALLGAVCALAGVYAADRLRSAATQRLGLPDAVFGHLEDGLVLFGGSWLLRKAA